MDIPKNAQWNSCMMMKKGLDLVDFGFMFSQMMSKKWENCYCRGAY